MTHYWQLNTMFMLVVSCLFLHGYTHGTAVESDTVKQGSEDPLSIPLISDKGAPLVAMLDTNTINRKIKSYIKTLMENMIQNILQGQLHDMLMIALKENSTIDLIRNISLQEPNEEEEKQLFHKDCTEIKEMNRTFTSGVYRIYPESRDEVRVYCDMETDGGGWTIIQKRNDGSVNFQRSWTEYENGFGNVYGEYWLGNKHIHRLTSISNYELRIDLTDRFNSKKYAKYKPFVVGDAASQYKLKIGGYSGNAGDAMSYHNGMKFTSVDRDNDLNRRNCATHGGPWWHKSCYYSALNKPFRTNLYWQQLSSLIAKTSIIMIRGV